MSSHSSPSAHHASTVIDTRNAYSFCVQKGNTICKMYLLFFNIVGWVAAGCSRQNCRQLIGIRLKVESTRAQRHTAPAYVIHDDIQYRQRGMFNNLHNGERASNGARLTLQHRPKIDRWGLVYFRFLYVDCEGNWAAEFGKVWSECRDEWNFVNWELSFGLAARTNRVPKCGMCQSKFKHFDKCNDAGRIAGVGCAWVGHWNGIEGRWWKGVRAWKYDCFVVHVIDWFFVRLFAFFHRHSLVLPFAITLLLAKFQLNESRSFFYCVACELHHRQSGKSAWKGYNARRRCVVCAILRLQFNAFAQSQSEKRWKPFFFDSANLLSSRSLAAMKRHTHRACCSGGCWQMMAISVAQII